MVRDKLTFANVMSVVAVFIALGGTAMALRTNSVGSRHIKNGAVKSRDVANGSLKGKDLREATIGAREIQEASFNLERFYEMKSQQIALCDPGSADFVTCGTVTLGLNEPSQALLVAGGGQTGDPSSKGTCKFLVNGDDGLVAPAPTFGHVAPANGFGLTAVTKANDLLQPGTNTFNLVCNETNGGDAQFSTTFSVLAIGGNG